MGYVVGQGFGPSILGLILVVGDSLEKVHIIFLNFYESLFFFPEL
jgi:hypothetical protein